MNSTLMNFIEWLLLRNIHFSVTSAFRTKEQNDACNGSATSQHLTGDAIDLKPVGLSVDDFLLLVEKSPFIFDQIIKYRTFIHFSFSRCRKPRQMKLDFTYRK